MSLFGAPGSVLIKTTLVKSLQRRRRSQHTDLALIKKLHAWLLLFFFRKCASITAVDLIQRKKFGYWKPNLAEARFEIIYFPTVLLE